MIFDFETNRIRQAPFDHILILRTMCRPGALVALIWQIRPTGCVLAMSFVQMVTPVITISVFNIF